jgi:hypothetical protein
MLPRRCRGVLCVAALATITINVAFGCRGGSPTQKALVAQAASPSTTQAAVAFTVSPRHITLAAAQVRLPIELVTGMPVISFQAADGSRHQLYLDTGADSAVFSPDLVAAQRLTSHPSARISHDPSGTRGGLQCVSVPALDLGVVRFERFDADVETLYAGTDGLLGWPLYQALLVTIDYPRRTVVFTQGDLPPPDGKDVLPLRFEENRFLIPVTLEDRDLWLLLDTGWGNGSQIELTAAQTQGLQWASPPVPSMASNTATGRITEKLGRLAGELRIGRHRVTQPIVGTNEGQWFGVLSALTLENFVLTLDLHNHRVRLERTSAEPIRHGPLNVAGFSCDLTSKPLKVTEVLPGGQAERLGLRAGDLLLKINGQSALNGLMSSTGDTYHIELHRGEQSITLDVPMTPLVP